MQRRMGSSFSLVPKLENTFAGAYVQGSPRSEGTIMSAPESRLKADSGSPVISAEVREVRRIAFERKEIAEQFERYKTREDLEQAFGETKKRESQLRQFIDTIPTLA
jgi:hypothetical protein